MKFYKIIIAASLSLGLMLTACGDFGDMNENPNAPTSVSNNPDLLLSYATKNIPDRMFRESWSDGGSSMAQYNAKLVFTGFDLFEWGSRSGLWNTMYTSIRNLNTTIEIGHSGYKAVALTLRAYSFSVLTDMYGDIPYSEAVQAKQGNIAPKYDAQRDVYLGVLKDLEDANDIFATNPTSVRGDNMLQGNMARWRKFANSLQLRIYMRMSKREPSLAQAGFAKIIGDAGKYPLLESNADNAELTYFASLPNTMPNFGGRVGSFNENLLCETLQFWLDEFNDPRIATWFRPTENSLTEGNPRYDGQKHGQNDGVAYSYKGGASFMSTWSRIFFEEPNSVKGILMPYYELQFILAEAALKGWIGGDPQTFYENGVKASFDYWKSEMPADYLTQQGVAYDGQLSTIIHQKYISNVMNGFEGFCDFQRTGFPANITPGPDALFPFIPYRFEYPSEEQNLNGSNYQQATSKLANGDRVTSPIWWQAK